MNVSKRKSLGQHFLRQASILEKIAAVIDPRADEIVIEIGPGKGALTEPLARRAGQVLAVEKDASLIPCLEELGLSNLTIINKDILHLHFSELTGGREGIITGNLPYSISSPLLFKVYFSRTLFKRCVFLLQKEVAERLCAVPGSKKHAPISLLYHKDFERTIKFEVKPGSFSPPPKVDSALVSLTRRKEPIADVGDDRVFLRFLRQAFRHRRKTLLNNFKALGQTSSAYKIMFEKSGIPLNARAEQVDLQAFVRLFHLFRADHEPFSDGDEIML